MYTFQVFSISTTDYQAGSNEFDIRIPQYRTIRIIAIAITCILLALLLLLAIYIYVKKRFFDPYPDEDSKLQRP